MLELKPIDFLDICKHFVDFQKKSKCYEMPPDTGQYIGAFHEGKLAGYLIVQGYDNQEVEINQGYLLPEYRHSNLPIEFMSLLEKLCKAAGYKKMLLGTHNRFHSYLEFAKQLGYEPKHLIFSKEI